MRPKELAKSQAPATVRLKKKKKLHVGTESRAKKAPYRKKIYRARSFSAMVIKIVVGLLIRHVMFAQPLKQQKLTNGATHFNKGQAKASKM